MSLEKALELARAHRGESEADLFEELRIPSISTTPESREDCRRNAEWLIDRFNSLSFETKLVDVISDGHPVVHAEWMGRPGAPVFTIYGHYDVQPPDPLDEWKTDPFEPSVENEFVVARGCADNKGNHMAALKSAEFWMAAGGPPLNLRFLIEGEEEIGGESLPSYLRSSPDALASDFVLLWDGGFSVDHQPTLVVGLRGSIAGEIEVRGPAKDLHSGGFGGLAPNPCNELARIITGLKDPNGRITIPGFYDDVVDVDPSEKARWHRPDDHEQKMKDLMGSNEFSGEEEHDLLDRVWGRPTLDVVGMFGGFTGEGTKTIIPAKATAKLSMRLVPNQTPDKAFELFETYVRELAPKSVEVKVTRKPASDPIVLGYDHHGARSAERAFEEAFDRKPVLVRSGGSIPVASAFHEALGAQMVISGIASPDSGAHSPNERLRLDNYHRGIEMLIRYQHHLADGQ